MDLRERWACPDLGVTREPGTYNPIPGSSYEFDDCPAYYLRTASMGMPAEHLIDGNTHPATLVSEWAFELESGSRSVDSLSPKARDLVHLHLNERAAKMSHEAKLRRERLRG
jgi:hypothetical protein